MPNTNIPREKSCQEERKTPPAALLIFKDGLKRLPIVVPNGGSPEADEMIMQWLQRKLLTRQGSKQGGVSVKVMARVWELSSASGGGLLALLAIADFANDNGVAWPSLSVLAAKARLSVRQLCTVLDELEKTGELKRERSTGGRNQRSRYVVTVSDYCEEITLKKLQRKNNSEICDTETVNSTSHAINHHRTINKAKGKPSPSKVSDPRIKELTDSWAALYRDRCGESYPFTEKDFGLFKSALRHFDLPCLKELTAYFFDTNSRWVKEEAGFTVGVFISQLASLASTSRARRGSSQQELPA